MNKKANTDKKILVILMFIIIFAFSNFYLLSNPTEGSRITPPMSFIIGGTAYKDNEPIEGYRVIIENEKSERFNIATNQNGNFLIDLANFHYRNAGNETITLSMCDYESQCKQIKEVIISDKERGGMIDLRLDW